VSRASGGGIVRFRAAIGTQDVISGTRVSDNNAASSAGGLYLESDSDTLIARSEFARNIAGFGSGGGISATAESTPGGTPELTIENTTIADNDASGLDTFSRGGGLAVGIDDAAFVMDLVLRQSTVTGNKIGTSGTSRGGNLHVEGHSGEAANVDISGSIIASGSGGQTRPDCSFDSLTRAEVTYTSDGGNIQGPNSQGGTECEFTNAALGDLQNTDPLLSALAFNGGLTQTRALQSGSPAINRVPSAVCAGITTDQRGAARPFPAGGACDSGAYELGDSDGDGALDNADNCPSQAGPASNGGCPLPAADPKPPAAKKCPKGKKPKKVKGKRKCVKKKKKKRRKK
jgi:hypothetical protein